MVNIKAVYSQMGVIVGDFINETEDEFEINNPVLLITQKENAALVPVLNLMEESNVTVKKNSVLSERAYTPVIEVVNHYNSIYGSGIIQSSGTFKI